MQAFARKMQRPWAFRFFLLTKLPSAFFSGIRVDHLDAECCSASVPYRWFTRNPFGSVYFACLAMAAEMSTGALAMGHLHGKQPRVSMLVTHLQADFIKKARGRIVFTCRDGGEIARTIEESVRTGEGKTCTATAEGINRAGESVAVFRVTWSFKARKNA